MTEAAHLLEMSADTDPVTKMWILLSRALMSTSVDEVYLRFLRDGMGDPFATSITPNGLRTMVGLYGIEFSDDELDVVVAHFDTNTDGSISIKEFREFCERAGSALVGDGAESSPKDLDLVESVSPSSESPQMTWASCPGARKPKSTAAITEARPQALPEPELTTSPRQSHDMLLLFGEQHATHLQIASPAAFLRDCGAARLATWGILYCGGAQPVVDTLTEFSKEYGAPPSSRLLSLSLSLSSSPSHQTHRALSSITLPRALEQASRSARRSSTGELGNTHLPSRSRSTKAARPASESHVRIRTAPASKLHLRPAPTPAHLDKNPRQRPQRLDRVLYAFIVSFGKTF